MGKFLIGSALQREGVVFLMFLIFLFYRLRPPYTSKFVFTAASRWRLCATFLKANYRVCFSEGTSGSALAPPFPLFPFSACIAETSFRNYPVPILLFLLCAGA